MFVEVFLLIQVALIPVYIQEFKLTLLEVSFVATVPSLVQLLLNIPSGFLADRFNTKHLLFASMIVEGLSAIFVSQTNNFWTLVLGVTIMRISSPIYHISGMSRLSSFVKQEQVSKSMGFHMALGSVGQAIGSVSLAVFLFTLGWRWAYLFWAVPILTWGFILLTSSQFENKGFKSLKTEKEGRSSRLPLVFSAAFLSFLVTLGFWQVGITAISTYMTTYLVEGRGFSEATASLIFGFGPFIGIIGSLNGGYLGDKIGAKKALGWAIFGCAISLSILALVSHFYLLFLIYLLFAFFDNTVLSPVNTIVADITPVTDRGLSYSVYFFTGGIIASITPTIVAGFLELSGVWYVFPFSITFLATSLIMLQFLYHSKKQ
jgi:MFS family permease